MTIGGYTMKDRGFAIEVYEYEAGWSFLLQGDDAQQFRDGRTGKRGSRTYGTVTVLLNTI